MDQIRIREHVNKTHFWKYSYLCDAGPKYVFDELENWFEKEFKDLSDSARISRAGTHYILVWFHFEVDALQFKLMWM